MSFEAKVPEVEMNKEQFDEFVKLTRDFLIKHFPCGENSPVEIEIEIKFIPKMREAVFARNSSYSLRCRQGPSDPFCGINQTWT
jgi:hypothetical protein